jgi:hypothetical protein
MADESDPTEAPEFKRVLGKLLTTPHKPQAAVKEAKGGKPRGRPPKAKEAATRGLGGD